MSIDKELKGMLANSKVELLNKYSFYYYYLSLVNLAFSRLVPTAGLMLDQLSLQIVLNPEFFAKQDRKKRAFLLAHEVDHMILNHIQLHDKYPDFKLFNLSSDAYINYNLEKLMGREAFIDGGVDWVELEIPEDIVKSGTDAVYRHLRNPKNQNSAFSQFYGNDCSGGHKLWKELKKFYNTLSETDQEIFKRYLNEGLKTLATNANTYCKGSIPAHLKKHIDKILEQKVSNIDWKKELRTTINMYSESEYVKKSYFKPSKYYKDLFSLKIKFFPKVALIVDTSGSMHNLVLKAYAELINIANKTDLELLVIECDAAIDEKESVYKFVSTSHLINKLKNKGYTGGGGTVVDPAILYINKRKDLPIAVYITDGEVSPPRVDPRFKLIPLLVKPKNKESFTKSWNNFKILVVDE